jgi:hypothetical protein
MRSALHGTAPYPQPSKNKNHEYEYEYSPRLGRSISSWHSSGSGEQSEPDHPVLAADRESEETRLPARTDPSPERSL